MLPLEAAAQYGLLTPHTYEATDLAKELAALPESELWNAFAHHILMNHGGLRVLQAIDHMRLDGLRVTGDSLARYLSSQGFRVTEHNTAINTLRLWLDKAKILDRQWRIDRVRKEQILGLNDEIVSMLSALSEKQRAFVHALCLLRPDDWILASSVRTHAEVTTGQHLGRDALTRLYLDPLVSVGLIEFRSGGTSGGKSAWLRTTPKFNSEVLEQFISKTIDSLDPAIAAYYKDRPEDIYEQLDDPKPFVRGQALEAFAIHVMRLLGLRFAAWRKRGTETGGSEVDALLFGIFGGSPTRWQVQCKNLGGLGRVDLEDVAKEVGLLPISNATHILILANGKIGSEARKFALKIMQESPVTIFLLDKDDFLSIRSDQTKLAVILRDQADSLLEMTTNTEFWTR